MSIRRLLRDLFTPNRYTVRFEGTLVDGTGFTLKQSFDGGDPDDPQARQELREHARRLVHVERGVRVATIHWVGMCKVHPGLEIDGKVLFKADLADGRSLSGRLPYQGTLDRDDSSECRRIIADQILVKYGVRCTSVQLLGAY